MNANVYEHTNSCTCFKQLTNNLIQNKPCSYTGNAYRIYLILTINFIQIVSALATDLTKYRGLTLHQYPLYDSTTQTPSETHKIKSATLIPISSSIYLQLKDVGRQPLQLVVGEVHLLEPGPPKDGDGVRETLDGVGRGFAYFLFFVMRDTQVMV